MAYQVALNFEDGVTRFIDCDADETVLDAAYRNKIDLPMSCLGGVCGTCKCRCEMGDYDLGNTYLENALTADEVAEGMVLTCQMKVASDCVVAVPAPSTASRLKPVEHQATVSRVELVGDGAILLTLRPSDPAALAFLPGQYVDIDVPGTGEHRSYSFSSKPGAEKATFLIRRLPGGLMSTWLTERAAPGMPLRLVGPYGSFFLRAVDRPVVLLAGGTGLAPILSMLEVIADRGTDQPLRLLYGVNTDGDLAELPRIEALAGRLPTLQWDACVADPGSAQPLKGFVTDHLRDAHLQGGDCDIYLCGPPAMVEAVRIALRDKGVTPQHFHYEKFTPSAALAPEAG